MGTLELFKGVSDFYRIGWGTKSLNQSEGELIYEILMSTIGGLL